MAGATLHTWDPWAQALAERYRVIRIDLPGAGLTGADPTGDYADARAVLTRYHHLMRARGVRAALLAHMGQTVLQPPEPWLAKVTVPTLLLWGEQDAMIPITNAQDYLSTVPEAVLVSLPGLGHVPFEEAPAVALAPVTPFLSR